jgi:hypothetical protein
MKMAEEAAVWSCLGALSWAWAVPFAMRKSERRPDSFRLRFLALWFLPGLLFYAIFHVGDPDHTLSIVPATCVAGALVLARLARRTSRPKAVCAVLLCVLLNVFLFLKPISKTAKASTYKPVRWMDGYVADIIDGVRRTQRDGPFTAVFHDSMGEWRHISYYEPRARLLVVETTDGRTSEVRTIVRNRVLAQTSVAPHAALPVCGPLVLIDPLLRPPTGISIVLDSPAPRVFFTLSVPGRPLDFHGVRFVSTGELCPSPQP